MVVGIDSAGEMMAIYTSVEGFFSGVVTLINFLVKQYTPSSDLSVLATSVSYVYVLIERYIFHVGNCISVGKDPR